MTLNAKVSDFNLKQKKKTGNTTLTVCPSYKEQIPLPNKDGNLSLK
jgi:hypothetical protein